MMHVLQAMEKLEKLNDQMRALEISVDQLELRNEYNYEARLLTEIRDEIKKEATELTDRLKKTPLVSAKGLDEAESVSAANNPFC